MPSPTLPTVVGEKPPLCWWAPSVHDHRRGPLPLCSPSVDPALLGDSHTFLSSLKPFATPLHHRFQLRASVLFSEKREAIRREPPGLITTLISYLSLPHRPAVTAGGLSPPAGSTPASLYCLLVGVSIKCKESFLKTSFHKIKRLT